MLLLLLAQATIQEPLNLTCFGAGTARTIEIATANNNTRIYGSVGTIPVTGNAHGSTTAYIPGREDFSDQVDIRLFSGDDRIRLPRSILPIVRGGNDGWFKLKKVVAESRSIRANAAVNMINNPKVFIDRVTGTISISGKGGNYTGNCQVVDDDAAPKF